MEIKLKDSLRLFQTLKDVRSSIWSIQLLNSEIIIISIVLMNATKIGINNVTVVF